MAIPQLQLNGADLDWVELETDAYRWRRSQRTGATLSQQEQVEDNENSDTYRGRLDNADDFTRKTLLKRIERWRQALRDNAIDDEEFLLKWENKWKGGSEDEDDHLTTNLERPTLDEYLADRKHRHFVNNTRQAYLLTFYKFCPSAAVRKYLKHRMRIYKNVGQFLAERLQPILEQYDILKREADDKLQAREEERVAYIAELEAQLARDQVVRINAGLLDKSAGWFGGFGNFEGGNAVGAVKIWLKQDSSGRIIDRVAIKDTGNPPLDDPIYWHKGVTGGVPNEVQCLYELRGLVGSNTVIKIRNWRPWTRETETEDSDTDELETEDTEENPKAGFRQYLEYCPHGDLLDLMVDGRYLYWRTDPWETRDTINRFAEPEVDHSAGFQFIPEPFIWYCLDNLTTAGLLMERGELDKHGIKLWETVIHRDFKPDNIFLGPPSDKQFRGYPEPKLADFGHAIRLTAGLRANPGGMQQRGTDGCNPHELLRNDLVPGSKSNVFGVGLMGWCLIMLADGGPPELNYQNPDMLNPGAIDASARTHYTGALCDLVERCVQYQMDDRPSFDEMREIIRRHTDGGIRDRAANDAAWRTQDVRLYGVMRDKYRLGMAATEVPNSPTHPVDITNPLTQDTVMQDDLGGPVGVPFTRNPDADN